MEPVQAPRRERRDADEHPHHPGHHHGRRRHAVLFGPCGSQRRGRHRGDDKPEPEPGQCEIDVNTGNRERPRVIPGGQRLDGPPGHQHVRPRRQEQPDGRRGALRTPRREETPEHRSDGQCDQEPRQQERAPHRAPAQDERYVHHGDHERRSSQEARAERGRERHRSEAGRIDQTNPRPRLSPGEGEQQEPGPADGPGSPRGEEGAARIGVVEPQDQRGERPGEQQASSDIYPRARPGGAARRNDPVHRDGRQRGQRDVHPEQPSPSDRGRHPRSIQGADDAPQLLGGADDPERQGASVLLPQVAHQGERHGKQRAARRPLHQPPGHEDRKRAGRGRDRRPRGEAGQADLDHDPPPDPVGQLAEKRHARHVPEEVSGHDGGGPFQPVDRDAQVPNHRDQDGDDDVGVEGAQQDGQAAHAGRGATSALRGGDAHEAEATTWKAA